MADGMFIDGAGFNQVAAEFGAAGPRAETQLRQAGMRASKAVESDGKVFAPVDTGFMRNTIGVDWFEGDGWMEWDIGPTAGYAPHVEDGTSTQAPQAFMGPALDRNTPDFVTACQQIQNEAVAGG